MERERIILDDAEAVAAAVAELVREACRARPAVGIMLAGGTTPKAAYERLGASAEAAGAASDFDGVHVWFGDERMVHQEHPDSNYGMAARAWLARTPGAVVHRIRGELGGIEAARQATAELRAHASSIHAGAVPQLDLVLLGVGADGHTASLFPGDPALAASDAALFFPARGGARVTATLPLLAAARRVVFIATGAGKAAVIAQILAAPPSPDRPASLVAASATSVTWLLDREAAALLR